MERKASLISDLILEEQSKDIGFFMQGKAMYGSVVWPDDSDIAPERLYEESIPVK